MDSPSTREAGETAGLCRLKLLCVTREVFADILKSGVHSWEVVDHPLPDDAHIRDAAYDPDLGMFTLTVESATFPPVGDGAAIPEMMSPVVHALAGARGYEAPDS